MRLRSTYSSGILAALVAIMLVASVIGPVAAAELHSGAQNEVNTNADAAHNPWIATNVTKSTHQMGWAADEYEGDQGDVQQLPAEVNSTYDNPFFVTYTDIEADAFGKFPCDSVENDPSDRLIDADEWTSTTSDTTNVGPTVSNVTTATGVEAVEVATGTGMGSGDTATFSYKSFNVTSDVDKRYLQIVLDINTLDSATNVAFRVHDTDGDYVTAEADTTQNYATGNTIANSTGDGYVFQQQIGTLSVSGSGDGTMQEIEKVDVQFSDGDANIDIVALNVEKTSPWTLGEQRVDSDGTET